MSPSLGRSLFRLPTVQELVSRLADTLSQGRSLLLLVPPSCDVEEMWSSLRAELLRKDFSVRELDLRLAPVGGGVAEALGSMLGVEWASADTPRTIEGLIAHRFLPDVVCLRYFDGLPESSRQPWADVMNRWARATHGWMDADRPPPALCVVTTGRAGLPHAPTPSLGLAVHWLWSPLSSLEVRLLCRLERLDNGSALSQWREYLLPAVAGGDLRLVEFLWDRVAEDLDGLEESLSAFASDHGWMDTRLDTAWGEWASRGSVGGDGALTPPEHLLPLWADGVVQFTPEYGMELHIAAAALLGLREEVRHRVWRGQASLLLPLVDGVRIRVCRYLTRLYGEDWPTRWMSPSSEEDREALRSTPYACPLGHLASLLRHCRPLRSHQGLLPVVEQARWVRNELAHYRPIKFRSFEILWREVQRLSQPDYRC